MERLAAPEGRDLFTHLLGFFRDDFLTKARLARVCTRWRAIIIQQDPQWSRKIDIMSGRINSTPGRCAYAALIIGFKDVVISIIDIHKDWPWGWNFDLMNAAQCGHCDLVDFFIAKGIIADYGWDDALYAAAERGHHDMVEYLEKRRRELRSDTDK